jgi:hypothetical protein
MNLLGHVIYCKAKMQVVPGGNWTRAKNQYHQIHIDLVTDILLDLMEKDFTKFLKKCRGHNSDDAI